MNGEGDSRGPSGDHSGDHEEALSRPDMHEHAHAWAVGTHMRRAHVHIMCVFSISIAGFVYVRIEKRARKRGSEKDYKGERGTEMYTVKDDQAALDFFASQWATKDLPAIVKATLSNTAFWDTDLTQFDGLEAAVTTHLEAIQNNGMKAALDAFVK